MKRFSLLIILFNFATFLQANPSQRLPALGHWNERENSGYNDVWGYTSEDGREYALLGVRNGTSIIDITEPSNLREVAFIESPYSIWKDIKTYQHYAYVVNETSGGMQILDLSELPERVTLVGNYTGFSNSHNIYIDLSQAILYAEGNHAQPVRLISLADPLNPIELSTFGVECHDIYARDGIVFVSEGGHGTIGIFDATDPYNVRLRSRFQIPQAGYVHNAWLDESGHYLMTTEETTGKTIKMWDVSDLDNVKPLGSYLAPNGLAHNTHIKGSFAYISHYGSGLRIVDISDPSSVFEAAYFLKENREPEGFVNAWGAFPFFDSSKVLVSDIETGLYVVEHKGVQ